MRVRLTLILLLHFCLPRRGQSNHPSLNPHQSTQLFMRRARQPFPRRGVYCFGHATGTSELTSEDELIRRAKEGDLEAFCGLTRAYERRVYAVALHYCRRPEDAEDLSQEVWLKAFKSLGGFRRESSFHTWL